MDLWRKVVFPGLRRVIGKRVSGPGKEEGGVHKGAEGVK